MADIGFILLVLALLASAYSAAAFVLGVKGRQRALVESGRNGLLAACGLLSLSVVVMLTALLSHDFTITYVVNYSSRSMSVPYLLSALWAGNTGSLLFWAWLLSIFAVIAVLRQWRRNPGLVPHAGVIIMITQAFFILLLIFAANPFEKMPMDAVDGYGLNPLLQNPGMIIHPPLLLGGYVALTIPFAFGMAALLTGRLGDRWLTVVRGWSVLAWVLLGIGNIVGAWWAYVELGWGGYWAWDPVENAGLLPMLPLTAFLHSSIMQRRTGIFKKWSVALIATAFNLSILGTFLTRSGILAEGGLSVHSFPDTGMGQFFLVFLAISVIGSVALIYRRRADLQSEANIESPVSREGSFLLTNWVFAVITFTILLGTIYPLLSGIFDGRRIALGAEYFNKVASLPFLLVILLIAVCAFIGWKRATFARLGRDFLWAGVATVAIGVIMFVLGVQHWYALISLMVTVFALLVVLKRWFTEVQTRHRAKGTDYLTAFGQLIVGNGARYGGYLVHIGMILLTLGVIGSSFYIVKHEDVTLALGETFTINNYQLTYRNIDSEELADRVIVRAEFDVYRDGRLIGQLGPEKNLHTGLEEQWVSEVAYRSNLLEDLYIILLEWKDDGTGFFTIQVSPMINWMWIGGGIILIGGLVALWPRKEKSRVPSRVAAGEQVAGRAR
jgi:cytochrome c-type biogenesis protein CcmF